jgi:hypothetical protein
MRIDPETERLLDDVLAGAEQFRAELLERTLRQVRRRRRIRTVKRGLVGMALVALAAVWLWESWPTGRTAPKIAASRPVAKRAAYGMIESRPLEAGCVVQTKQGVTPIVSSSASSVAVAETEPGQHLYTEINDDQLLLLLAGRSAALVREGPGSAEVLILGSEKGLP